MLQNIETFLFEQPDNLVPFSVAIWALAPSVYTPAGCSSCMCVSVCTMDPPTSSSGGNVSVPLTPVFPIWLVHTQPAVTAVQSGDHRAHSAHTNTPKSLQYIKTNSTSLTRFPYFNHRLKFLKVCEITRRAQLFELQIKAVSNCEFTDWMWEKLRAARWLLSLLSFYYGGERRRWAAECSSHNCTHFRWKT